MPNANAIANVFKLIEENDIKFALLRFTDIKGKEHGVSIPVSLVDEDMFEYVGNCICIWHKESSILLCI